ncbi:GntR family transcriptional regulator [Fusibacter sp. JL298sf-3]
MFIDYTLPTPIYVQIAEAIKEEILSDALCTDERVYSTNVLAAQLEVNPATALKGLNLLIEEGMVYKKRGIGMFVSENAKALIVEERKRYFFDVQLEQAILTAKKLGITREALMGLIDEKYKGGVL